MSNHHDYEDARANRCADARRRAAFTFAGAGAAQAAPAIPLTGGQETPRPNDFGAHGWFSYEIDGTEFCYTLEVDGALRRRAVAAHVHVAPRNVPGPVVIRLGSCRATSFEVSACGRSSPPICSP